MDEWVRLLPKMTGKYRYSIVKVMKVGHGQRTVAMLLRNNGLKNKLAFLHIWIYIITLEKYMCSSKSYDYFIMGKPNFGKVAQTSSHLRK